MKKRVVLFLAGIGTLILLTASFQRLQPTQQLTVYDADGKKVGVVTGGDPVGGSFRPLVPLKIDGIALMLGVLRDGFTGHATIAWESTDCTGTPFLQITSPGYTSQPSSFPLVGVGLPGNTVYVEDGPVRPIAIRSYSTIPLQGPGTPLHQCVRPQAEYDPYIRVSAPARPLIDMNTLYTPPFTVR